LTHCSIIQLIRVNQTKFYLLHEAIYQNEPFNQQYAIDYEHQSLIFAVHSEVIHLKNSHNNDFFFFPLISFICMRIIHVHSMIPVKPVWQVEDTIKKLVLGPMVNVHWQLLIQFEVVRQRSNGFNR